MPDREEKQTIDLATLPSAVKDKLLEQFLSQQTGQPMENKQNKSNPINDLVDKAERFLGSPTDFAIGDIVRWKPGLKNKKYPKEGQYAVVIEQLKDAIRQDQRDSGTPYFREPLDLGLASLDEDGDLVVFYYDKRRFELYQKSRISSRTLALPSLEPNV